VLGDGALEGGTVALGTAFAQFGPDQCFLALVVDLQEAQHVVV
jgi:hypothetical protein